MRLVGWNDLPLNHGATFDAPRWLRVWMRLPFLDRFGYPVAVRRGYGWLRPSPGYVADPADIAAARADGWRFWPDDRP